MVIAELIIAVVIVIAVLLTVVRSVRIIPQARARNVERFGRYRKTLEPGMNFIIPFVDRVKAQIDLREQVVAFTGRGRGTGTGTEIMTVTVTVNGTGTGTVIVIVIGTENENATAIVRGSETVAPGTTAGMMTTHDGHRVTTVVIVIVNGIGKVTHHETVVTETEIVMPDEGQVQERMTGNDVQEGMGRTREAATMNRERSARPRTRSEVRNGQNTIQRHLHPRTGRVELKHQRRERYDRLTFRYNSRLLSLSISILVVLPSN